MLVKSYVVRFHFETVLEAKLCFKFQVVYQLGYKEPAVCEWRL